MSGAPCADLRVVEFAQALQGQTIPASGFFLAARSTLTLNGAVPNLVLPATPEFENSDNVTHMLVFGFTGALNQDLDTNDDGTLDVTPWATMLQSIAFIENNATPPVGTEYAYGDVRVGPDANGFVPSQLAYCPTTSAWTIGPFDFVLTPGFDTPGAANAGCDRSFGHDGDEADLARALHMRAAAQFDRERTIGALTADGTPH